MDYREEIAGIGDVEGESIAVGSRGEYESKIVDSLLHKQSSRIVGELEEKGRLRLNESGGLGVSPLKHEEVGVFEKPGFTNADSINGSFPEQELPSKVREQSDENQTVDEIDRTGENEQGTFPELSETSSCLEEERNTESIKSCPPIPELHHHLPNETGEPSVEDGKITENPVPEVLHGKEIETEDVNENAPVGVVEPNIEHETAIREKDDSTNAEEPEIITYHGRDLGEEGYRGNLPGVGLENENVLQTEELKGKDHSVFFEESGGVEGDGLEKAIPRDSQFTENYNIAEKKGEEIGIFSSNEDARKPVTEGGDEADGQIEGTVEPQLSEASVPEEKVDVEVPNEEVAPDIPNVKDNSVDGLPSAEVSALRDKILDEDEIPKSSNDDVDEIDFGDHKEEDVQEDDVIGNDGLSKGRELTTKETVTAETGLPAPGEPSNRDSASHPGNDFAEGGKNEGSEADSTGITREITDQVVIERDDASPDSNVYTEAMDGYQGNDPISVPEVTRDEFQPDVAEQEAPSGANASNEFDIAGEEDTSSGLTLSGDHTKKEYEEVSSRTSSGAVAQEKAAEVSTELADPVPGRDNDAEAHSVKDDDTGTRKENETLESTDRDAETDDASDPIETEVPIVADSLGDFVQQETRVIPPEQESLTETSARPLENFAEERNVSEEALSTLEDQPLDVPCASSEVKHKSEESNISEEVPLHAGLSVLTNAAHEVSETQTANVPEALTEEKLNVDQRSAELDTEISSVVPLDSNIDSQSASNEASNYEEASAAEAVVTESKIPDEKISKKSFEQLKQDADEIDEDGKPTGTEGESELDNVPDQEVVLEYTNMSAGNVLNDTFEKSEKGMNTEQPHDMADLGDITLIEVPREQIEEAPVDTTIPSIDLKDSNSDDQLASNKEPKYEESSAPEVVTNRQILEEKILARSFDGESEAQIGQDADEVEKYEETAPEKGNSAGEHDEVLTREEVPSVLDETTVDGKQQQDIANQIDIPLTEATVETTEKAAVYDSAIDASTDNQRDVLHFGTPTQDQDLQTNQKRDEPTNDDATSTLPDGTKIDRQTEETPDITLSETTDEVASKIQEDDSFGVAGEVLENPIDGQSASNEDSNYDEASAAEAVVTKSKILDESATEEQSRQDADEIDGARELDVVPNGEEVLEATNASSGKAPNEKFEQLETEVSGEQPHDMVDQGDIALTEVHGEPIKQDGVDTTIPLVDQKYGRGDDQLASMEDPKFVESSAAEAVTEGEILEEKILTRSFDDSLEAQIEQDADEAEKYGETAPGEGNSAREHDEVPAREEVPSVLVETVDDGVQQQDITDQTYIMLTEATVETTGTAAVYDLAIDASTDNQRDVSHFGTPPQDQELQINQKRDEPTNDDATSTLQDGTKIDRQTEETPDITLRETTDEVASKIQEDDSFGVAGEVRENPIDDQSASNEDSNYDEASAAEAMVNKSKIPDESATEEQSRQDADEIDGARELGVVPNGEEVLEATNASSGNAPNEKFEQLETEVSGKQPHDMVDQGDIALTEVHGEPIKQDGVDTTIPLVDQKDGRGDGQLASMEDPKYEESSAAEAVTEGEILEEKILPRSFDDSLEAQIGQDADEAEKYGETAPGEGNSAREHDEVPAREEVPSVLDETVVDGVQQQDITDQTDITLTEATVETTEKDTVYDSAIDASTDNQRDVSHFGTSTQDQKLQTNQKRDEPTNDDATSTLQDGTKIDRQTEETPDITLSETTDEVASKIQEDDSFRVAGDVSENPFDGQSASNEDSNYEEASAEEAVFTKSTAEEQSRQDADEIDGARELDVVPNGEEVLEATNASSGNATNEKFEQLEMEVSGEQPHDMVDQGDIALTEVPGEPIKKDGVDTTIPLVDQKDGSGDDQLASMEDPKFEESSAAEAVTEGEILEEKILPRSFDDSLEAQIGQDADEEEKYGETAPGEGNSAREHEEVPAREEVPTVFDETVVDGMQQQDITDQTDIMLTEATLETTEKAAVYDSAIDASTNNQRDVSHFGTPTQDQELQTNQKRDETTDDDAASTCWDYANIDTPTAETPDITFSETTGEVVSKIQVDDSFGVAGEVRENPIDVKSASNEDSNYDEASAADAVVSEGKIPEETATKEQLRQDTIEIDDSQELDEVPNREEVLEAANTSAGNAPNEKFKQLETEVSGELSHDMADQGDNALTEVLREPIEQDGVDTTIPLVDQKDGRGDDQLASNEDPKYEESSVAEAATESEILEEKILTRSFGDSLEAQIGQAADETEKHGETAVGEGNSAREHDEVPAREEVTLVLNEIIVDGVQQQDITDQTDIALAEATVETTEKAAVYDSATDASIDDQIDASYFGTLTQDQELKTNKKQDETKGDDAASTSRDYAKKDTPTEETRKDVEEPALGQGDEGSSLVDDNINENERGTVGSSVFMDAADSIKEIKEDGLQMEDVNEPLTGTGITEDEDSNDIVEKDLIYGTESDEKIDAGEVASETKDISSREVEQYEQHVGESASHLQVGFSETPESEPSFDQTMVVDQTEEERKEIYDSNDRDGEIADPDVQQSSVNEVSDEQTEEEKAAVEVDSNIVSGTETGITDTEPSQTSRDVNTESFEERNSVTENTENKEYFYEEGKYNIESKDRPKEVTRSEELVDAKETSDEAVFSHSELVESAVAEEGILDQGIGMENSYERDSSLVPPEENEVKDQEASSGAATDSFSEKKEQDKEAKEPYEEISHPEQRDLVDITEADYDKGTTSFIPVDTQELITFEGDIQKDEACIKNKMEASENEGIRGLPHEDDQQGAQDILAEEVALEGEIASKDVETDHIVQEDEKDNKEAEDSREANEDEINKDVEVNMGSSMIDEESLANTAPATETADLENKDSYTTADNSHVEVIEGEKSDLTLSNEIVEEGDSYTAGADTPFSERSISDNQPGMSSENLGGENAGEVNAAAESVEDVAGKEEAPVDSEGHVVEVTGQRELVIATEVSDEAALSDTQNETAMTLQTQPRDHSYEQDYVESAPAEGSTIEFNGENEQARQDKTSDEQSSRVEIDNPKAEVEGIKSNEVLQNEAETTEGGSAEEAPQLAHYTEISSHGPSDEISAFSTSVRDDVQEREIREIVASEDDQTSRTIQEVSEHTNVDGVASADAEAGIVKTTRPTQNTGNMEEESIGETSATITPDENDDSKEESFVVENQITSEQILESTDHQIEPIPSGEAVQVESEVVESAPIGKSTLDENPSLRVSEKESESEGIQSRATNEAWSDGKEPTLQTDISQDESDTSIPKYADKERDVTETEEITPLDLGDRGFASAVQTKEISTEEDASKIKEVVSEDAGESIGDAIREVIPVTTDTQPSMSSEYLDGENAGELNPTALSVEDGASEEVGTDAGIQEASEALVDSKGHEEEATGQSELINATEVSADAALSDVPDETAVTIQTVPADDLYERDFFELTEESKVDVESATADGSTIECYGNTEQDIEDKTSNEQTSQVEIDNRDLAADFPPRDVLATAENVEIDQAAFDERTTRSSDICKQKSALVEEVERDRSLELSTLEEAFIQTDREDISLPPEVEVGGSESNEVLQNEAETKEGGSVQEAPQFAHSMEISSDGPSDQIPALSTSVPDNVQEIRTPEIVTSEDDQTIRTIRKELDDDSGNKVEQEENAENEEKEIGVVHTQEYTSNEERPANGVFVEETIASDQLTQEQESSNRRSGENIGEVIKDVYTDVGGVAAAGIVKPTEPTEITGNLENESIGEMGKTVMPDETDDSKEESFVEPIPHEEAVIAETEDVEPVSVGESTLDQSPLADVSREVSTLLHSRTEAWSDGNEPTLQADVCQDESDTSMSKFADKEIDVQESEKVTPLELGNRDFTSAVQTKVVLTEEDTSKIKEVVSKGAGGRVDEAIGEVIPVTSDTQPSMSSEYLDSENGGELNSASVLVEDVAGKEVGTDAGIEETSEVLIDSKGHEVEATGQRYLINTMEVSHEAALSDTSNETAATIQIVPITNGSIIEFDGENEQEVQDKTFNEQASQVEIDNQDLAAYMPTRDVPATVENVDNDRAELDEQTDGIGRSLSPEAETGGNERNQVLQNESETKEKFSGEEALQSTKISSDGPSDQMSAFSTSIPDAVQEREIREIVASEDEQTNRTIQEELVNESGNKVEQGDNAEKAEQEITSNEERLVSGQSFEETISSDQLTQSTEQESNGSLGGENVSEVIKYVYTDIGGVSSADAEADITKTTQPTHSTGNLEEESIGETSTAVIPDENLLVPREEAVLAETEDVEQASVGESTLEQNPLADESTLLHARTEVWPDGNEPTLQTDVRQDESDTSRPKYAEKERDVPATGKIAPPELGDRDFSSEVPTKDILTEEDASKTEEVESVDVAADDTKEQPSVTTEDTILKNKEVRDDTGHAAGKPEDAIEVYGDNTSAAASVVDAETTIPRGNEETAEVGESVDDAIGEVIPMTSDSSSPVPKEEEMLATETEHEKENAVLEISQRNHKDTADLKYANINEMAADIPSTDGQALTGSVSYLPQGSIDAITAASVDQESASLTLPSEETVVDKAWTSRESPDAEHFEVGFKETGTGDDTAENYGESRSMDFISAQADQETKNEINRGEILADGDAADKADYGLASEAVEIADKVDPSLKEEKAFDEAQIFQEMASQGQDEYKQGAADEDKAPILSDANDPVEGTVDRAPLEEAEGQTFDSVEGMCTDKKMETPVPNVQGSSEEIFEGDRTFAIEESKELNQVIASKEDAPTEYHDSGSPRDASPAKEVMANLPGSTERGQPPAEARDFRDQSEVNLDSKEFEGEKFSDDTTTVPQTPVADNLQLPEQSAIIKPEENEEHEDDDHEHIEHSDATPLMAESSKDVVNGKARQKKLHNHLLSGMSSKVKSSISKVKRVITGKSSNHNKEHSPKHGQ